MGEDLGLAVVLVAHVAADGRSVGSDETTRRVDVDDEGTEARRRDRGYLE